MKLTSFQKDVILSSILGDGYLQKTGKNNARIRLEHGFKQKEYLLWKAKQLGCIFQGKPKFIKRTY